MEISNHGPKPQVRFTDANKGQTSARSLEGASGVEQTKPQRLLERLDGDAKVRERLLVEIKAKVHAGEYSTRAAAVEAAEQIVDP